MDLLKHVPPKLLEENDTKTYIQIIESNATDLETMVNDFHKIYDIDKCEDKYIDEFLYMFNFNLPYDDTVITRRQIVKVIHQIYKGKGTDDGIEFAILTLLGIDVTITKGSLLYWRLGISGRSELGVTTLISATDSLFEMIITINESVTADQKANIIEITDKMSCSWCRFKIIET